jgi:hypothetical protein
MVEIYKIGSSGNNEQINNYVAMINQKVDAVYETSSSYSGASSWFGAYSLTPTTYLPWFLRSENYEVSSGYGVFDFNAPDGVATVTIVLDQLY